MSILLDRRENRNFLKVMFGPESMPSSSGVKVQPKAFDLGKQTKNTVIAHQEIAARINKKNLGAMEFIKTNTPPEPKSIDGAMVPFNKQSNLAKPQTQINAALVKPEIRSNSNLLGTAKPNGGEAKQNLDEQKGGIDLSVDPNIKQTVEVEAIVKIPDKDVELVDPLKDVSNQTKIAIQQTQEKFALPQATTEQEKLKNQKNVEAGINNLEIKSKVAKEKWPNIKKLGVIFGSIITNLETKGTEFAKNMGTGIGNYLEKFADKINADTENIKDKTAHNQPLIPEINNTEIQQFSQPLPELQPVAGFLNPSKEPELNTPNTSKLNPTIELSPKLETQQNQVLDKALGTLNKLNEQYKILQEQRLNPQSDKNLSETIINNAEGSKVKVEQPKIDPTIENRITALQGKLNNPINLGNLTIDQLKELLKSKEELEILQSQTKNLEVNTKIQPGSKNNYNTEAITNPELKIPGGTPNAPVAALRGKNGQKVLLPLIISSDIKVYNNAINQVRKNVPTLAAYNPTVNISDGNYTILSNFKPDALIEIIYPKTDVKDLAENNAESREEIQMTSNGFFNTLKNLEEIRKNTFNTKPEYNARLDKFYKILAGRPNGVLNQLVGAPESGNEEKTVSQRIKLKHSILADKNEVTGKAAEILNPETVNKVKAQTEEIFDRDVKLTEAGANNIRFQEIKNRIIANRHQQQFAELGYNFSKGVAKLTAEKGFDSRNEDQRNQVALEQFRNMMLDPENKTNLVLRSAGNYIFNKLTEANPESPAEDIYRNFIQGELVPGDKDYGILAKIIADTMEVNVQK